MVSSSIPAPLSTPIPPVQLIRMVSGEVDSSHWAASRRSAVSDAILPQLREAGVELPPRAEILDFGCGCGRILAGWEGLLPESGRLFGVDINDDLVAFCKANIPFAAVSHSKYDPPLDFADAKFDFVYGASVLTHMTLPTCLRWAAEFARIIKPGGTLMMSYHGAYYAGKLRELSQDGELRLQRDGYYIHLHGEELRTFRGSNDYASFMTSEFVTALFNRFDLLRLRPGNSSNPTHFASYQDVAILRRAVG
jgi:SAM-dependent methyltransferase